MNVKDNSRIYKPNLMTLCFLQKGDEVLLGRKARKIGKGLWNGLGGNVEEDDETIENAARREVKEEIGVEVGQLTYLGEVDFKFPNLDNKINKVFMFATDDFKGDISADPKEISEVEWFDKNELPFDEMLKADKEFIPLLLDGKEVHGEVQFTSNFEIISCNIETMPRESDINIRIR